MASLPNIARATVVAHDMLPAGSVVLALVSGGADSVSLLRLLAAGDLGELGSLTVLHVDHMLRGAGSAQDAAFVESLCAELGVPCATVRYDVAAYAAEEGLNLEDAGRRVRYRFAEQELDARCAALGVPPARGRVATAHTLDDRLETFLMRLVAGSGAGGLRSIAPSRGRIVRPLIGVRRSEVTAYLGTLGQPWREDATNLDTSRARAWTRHELLPLIETRNPSFEATLQRSLAILAEEDGLLAEMAAGLAREGTYVETGALVFDRARMRALSRAIARRVVRHAVFGAFPDASRLEFEHVEAIVSGLADDAFARDLPDGLHARAEYGKLVVSRKGDEPVALTPGILGIPGECDLGAGGRIVAGLVPAASLSDDSLRAYLSTQGIDGPLVVDHAREGDRIRPLGMEGTKKISDLFVDGKVPRRLRTATPVVRYRDRVVWVAGLKVSEEFKLRDGDSEAVELRWLREQ